MAVTIKDVAARAGVNASTVSRVLKDSSEISDKTKAKVRKAIDELGYRRNAAAGILASGKTNTIGVVFPPVVGKSNQPFFMQILTAINAEAQKSQVSIAIATGHETEEVERQVRLLHQEKRVDGFIVLYAGASDSVRDYMMEENIPFVLVGTPSESDSKLSCIDNDNHLMGRRAVQYLTGLGHERIAFVSNTRRGEVFKQRYRGFADEMDFRELKQRLIIFDEEELFGDETALVVLDDALGIKVIEVFIRAGKTVPKDVSVITFNNSIFSTLLHPQLTTFDINIIQLGAAAVQQFLSLSNKDEEKADEQKIIIPFELIERESARKL
ncbi:LacI family DNA-binding transcriptional regulator [Lactococcus termiticola]|uniref:LacI family transcriptional regulator n=1 Tax=Lactococcus termiticola TaxID=2169526 RepID=A0A2R5HL07_9LACT|nr:LacI family DNA-binding transcriptional regulator [Lactococcus termiticola]GBG97431.1 LacI family transcriptional regulator [Lactococcus termiticola]